METKHPERNLSVILGSVFWVGFLKPGPGTWGSLAALPLIWISYEALGVAGIAMVAILFSLITLLAAPKYESLYGQDPSSMVSDEVAGQAVPLLILAILSGTLEWWMYGAGFILFRIFDIAKPLGINRLQNMHGGWGILLDDILAGVYAFFCLKIVILTVL